MAERGNSNKILKLAYSRARNQSRETLLFSQKPQSNHSTVRVITRFIQQHDEIYGLLRKHWWLLRLDPKLRPLIKPLPEITYKQSTSIKDRLVRSHYSTDEGLPCCDISDTHRCSYCNVCNYMVSHVVIPSLGTRGFSCRHYVDCTTQGVVFL